MAQRSIWNGSLSVGVLVIPVTMSSSVSERDLGLHQFSALDNGRIRIRRVSEKSGDEVQWGDIRTGYEAPDGTVVTLSDEDFEEAYGGTSRNARIEMFTDPSNVPDMARRRPLVIRPARKNGPKRQKVRDEGAERAYALMAAALRETGMIAIVAFGIREQKRMAEVSERNGYLYLTPLEYAVDMPEPDFESPSPEISAQERAMARQVVEGFSGEFRHGDYSDESREKISGLIESRLAGTAKAATAGNPGEEKLMSLMEALQMTISQKAG